MRILYATTIGLTMGFFPEHIKMLLSEGHTVELACNCSESEVPEAVAKLNLKTYNIPFSRSPLSFDNLKAFKALKALIEKENFDIVHTHTPNASVISRLACRKKRKQGLKVFYTAHGFHFYKGAPLLNWLLFYPTEKLCSRFTDVLITINDEDFAIAKRKMHAKKVEQIPGVGIDLSRFQSNENDFESVRNELGIDKNEKILVYVAELNENKNQASLLDMMAIICKERNDVTLLLVGSGTLEEQLKEKAKKLKIDNKVIFAGYRNDVSRILHACDVAVPSSIREGFGLNIIEAMACGIPVVAYDNRGHRTIIDDGKNGYLVELNCFEEMSEKVKFLLSNPSEAERIVKNADCSLQRFSSACVIDKLKEVYLLN